jgi:hypothetical protein
MSETYISSRHDTCKSKPREMKSRSNKHTSGVSAPSSHHVPQPSIVGVAMHLEAAAPMTGSGCMCMRDSQPFGGAVQALAIGPWNPTSLDAAGSQAPACITANCEHMQLRLLLFLLY